MADRKLADEKKAIAIEDNEKMDEVFKGYRVLYLGEDNFIRRKFGVDSIRIYDKNILKISKYGDNEFVRERNRLLRDGDYVTYKEQMEILKKRGLWSEDHENRIEILRKKADELIEEKDALISKIDNGDKNASAAVENIKDEITKTHNELLELLTFQINFFGDTIEMKAQTKQQMGWMVSAICRNEGDDKYDENKRLWKSVEELEEDMKKQDFVNILNECNSFWDLMEGKNESFFAESPEELTQDSAGEHQKN